MRCRIEPDRYTVADWFLCALPDGHRLVAQCDLDALPDRVVGEPYGLGQVAIEDHAEAARVAQADPARHPSRLVTPRR
jgi:hypothetical protein